MPDTQPPQYVCFDTNVYRGNFRKIEELNQIIYLEQQRDIVPLVNVVVASELLQLWNANSAESKKRRIATAALNRLVQHCRDPESEVPRLDFYPPGDNMLAASLYENFVELGEKFYVPFAAAIVKASGIEGTERTLSETDFASLMDQVQTAIDGRESEYADGINTSRKNSPVNFQFNPNHTFTDEVLDWGATILLGQSRNWVNPQAILSRAEPESLAFIRANFKFPITLMLSQTFAQIGKQKDPEGNNSHDYQISFAASVFFRGSPTILVTTDGAFSQAATNTGVGNRVMTLNQYEDFLREN